MQKLHGMIRLITHKSLQHNTRISAKYIESEKNDFADALSRQQFDRFTKLQKDQDIKMEAEPTPIPHDVTWSPLQFYRIKG